VSTSTVSLNANTRVYVSLEYNNLRYYLTAVDSARREDTKVLYLRGTWEDDPNKSQAYTFETASLIRRRLKEESNLDTRIALAATGNASELIEE
jgi:hypothetical protein